MRLEDVISAACEELNCSYENNALWFEVLGDTIIFDHALAMVDGTKIVFHYFGLNTDKDDNIIIPDDWERMLVAYIGWKYTRRYINDFGTAVMANYQREYQTQKLANV